MSASSDQPAGRAHDVLAAEEFGVPAPDSDLHDAAQPAHDVLAAEEFGMGSADPSLQHGPLRLPDDPSGIAEPHDVLAAEEFAVPAGHAAAAVGGRGSGAVGRPGQGVGGRGRTAAALAFGAAVTILLRRRFS